MLLTQILMRSIFLSVYLFFAAAAIAQSAVLPSGAYQLVSARDEGSSGKPELSVLRVQVVARGSETSIVVGDLTADVRADEFGWLLFTLPVNQNVKGAAVAQSVYLCRKVTTEDQSMRFEGFYRVLWSGGEEKGRFALTPDDAEKG